MHRLNGTWNLERRFAGRGDETEPVLVQVRPAVATLTRRSVVDEGLGGTDDLEPALLLD